MHDWESMVVGCLAALLWLTLLSVRIRAGELTPDEIEKLVAIIQDPRQYKVPDWFLNRQRDWKTGKSSQVGGGGR